MNKLMIPGVLISSISLSLFAATQDSDIENRFTALDANEDGVVTMTEAKGTGIEANFAKIDTDGDGMVTHEEFETFVHGQREKLVTTMKENKKSPSSKDKDNVLGVVAQNEFKMMDTNGDGSISRDEAAEIGIADTFKDMDYNGDGKISLEEYSKHRKQNYNND